MDFYLLVIFGAMGLFMSKAKIPTAPLILGVIVGNTMEQSFRQAIKLSDGEIGIFVGSPVAISLLVLTVLSVLYPIVKDKLTKKQLETA